MHFLAMSKVGAAAAAPSSDRGRRRSGGPLHSEFLGARAPCMTGAASRGRPSGAGAAVAETTRWPSLERLSAIDVHTNGMPQGTLAELSSAMRGRTLLVMGDSVMEQFYNSLQCLMRNGPILAQRARAMTCRGAGTMPVQRQVTE